jgi:signal transduction histidine kinase
METVTEHAGRHRVVRALVLVHLPVFLLLGWRDGWSAVHLTAEVVVPILALWAVATFRRQDRIAHGAGAIGLMYCSAVLIHVTGGVTEAHFYFFVAFGLVALYRDWAVFFAAAGFAVAHHGVFALGAGVLFDQPYQIGNPLLWAAVHITFVAVVTAVQAVGMYDVARSVEARERAESAVALADERRRTALTLHDDVVQSLATANYARTAGEDELSGEALERALRSSRALVTELLADTPIDEHTLRRPAPALADG